MTPDHVYDLEAGKTAKRDVEWLEAELEKMP